MSNIGTPCIRKLWLEKNHPDLKIPFTPATFAKFQFGDLTEEYLLCLVELSGHTITGRQDEFEIQGIQGHRDCVIDGMLVDVKSASSRSFEKFKEGLTEENDTFGYLPQLLSYLKLAKDDPLVIIKDRAAFLVFDKQHGHICLDIHELNPEFDFDEYYIEKKELLASDRIPDRAFLPKPDGYKNKDKVFVPNGNELLDTACSYCEMKHACYQNIRTFMSSTGPKFYTKIVKQPKMLEITDV